MLPSLPKISFAEFALWKRSFGFLMQLVFSNSMLSLGCAREPVFRCGLDNSKAIGNKRPIAT